MKSTQDIVKSIGRIERMAKNFRGDVQVAACDIACHILEHGDVRMAGLLLNAVGDGSNFESLASWLATHAFCRMKGDKLVLDKKARDAEIFAHVTAAKAREVYEVTVSMAPAWCHVEDRAGRIKKVFDSFEAADNLIQRMLKSGDQQLAAKLADVVKDYKAAATGRIVATVR